MKALEGIEESIANAPKKINMSSEDFSERRNSNQRDNSLEVSYADKPNVGIKMSETNGQVIMSSTRNLVSYPDAHHISFSGLHTELANLANSFGKRIWILLDEWSSLPLEIQPYLADLIRRIFLPVRGFSVKIAAIEHRSNFFVIGQSESKIGFELGADIAADIDLDDILVFQNSPEKSTSFFKELFFRHLSIELGNKSPALFNSADDFIQKGFTQKNAFDELVRSSEGVPRDAINIAIIAARSADNLQISIPSIRTAARKWYQQDKESPIKANESLKKLLSWIIDKVIKNRKTKGFLLQESMTLHKSISELYDSRLIHTNFR